MSATVQRRVGQRAVNVRERGQCLHCSDTDIGIVDSIESLSADESQRKVFSARSRDYKHLNGWATKIAEPNEDGEHVSKLKEPDEGPE